MITRTFLTMKFNQAIEQNNRNRYSEKVRFGLEHPLCERTIRDGATFYSLPLTIFPPSQNPMNDTRAPNVD